jgi:catechol 2,3-dioxygenase-like lactoylglutathione lyase family enzyme
MNLFLSHCFVTVTDQDEALAFYRDVLGLELRNDVPFEGFRWVTVSPPAQPDVEIVLETPDMGRPPAARTSLEQLMAQGALSAVLFRADDVDATFEKIRASGAEVLQEPIDQPYGVRDCAFRDPFGNQVRISGRPA